MSGIPAGFAYAPAVDDAPIEPPPAESEHYCPTPGCDASWWGPELCWVCGAEGVQRFALPESDRKTWMWTDQSAP
jgi:hypothetical protein